MFITAMYAPVIPIVTVFAIIGLILKYWINKYNLLRRSSIESR
jgi:hypothetical protein